MGYLVGNLGNLLRTRGANATPCRTDQQGAATLGAGLVAYVLNAR